MDAQITVYYSGRWENLIIYSDELKREYGDQVVSGFNSQYYSLSQVAEILEISTNDLLKDIEYRRFTAHERVKVVDDVTEIFSYVPVPESYITRILAEPGNPFEYVISDDDSYDAWLKSGFIWSYPSKQQQVHSEPKTLIEKRIDHILSCARDLGIDLLNMQRGQKRELEDKCVHPKVMTKENFKRAWQEARNRGLIG